MNGLIYCPMIILVSDILALFLGYGACQGGPGWLWPLAALSVVLGYMAVYIVGLYGGYKFVRFTHKLERSVYHESFQMEDKE